MEQYLKKKQHAIIIDGKVKKVYNPKKLSSELIKDAQNDLTQDIIQKSEIKEALEELNNDELDFYDSRMSNIDLRSRLHHIEISSVLALDSLVSLGVLPTNCLAFTRQKKRLAVSLDGKGRDDIIEIVRGKEEREEKRSGWGKLRNVFGGQ